MTTPIRKAGEFERMTARGRAYVSIMATRHLLLGLCCLLMADSFTSTGYAVIKGIFPIEVWGVLALAGAVHGYLAAATGRESVARSALLGSAVMTSFWAMGFIISVVDGTSSGPTGAIVWSAIVLKDLVVCRQPLRSPFEPIIRELGVDRRNTPRPA